MCTYIHMTTHMPAQPHTNEIIATVFLTYRNTNIKANFKWFDFLQNKWLFKNRKSWSAHGALVWESNDDCRIAQYFSCHIFHDFQVQASDLDICPVLQPKYLHSTHIMQISALVHYCIFCCWCMWPTSPLCFLVPGGKDCALSCSSETIWA